MFEILYTVGGEVLILFLIVRLGIWIHGIKERRDIDKMFEEAEANFSS